MAEKEQQYMDFIKRDSPQIKITDMRFNLHDGKYNDIVIVNEGIVYKFAKYDWTVAFLANEANTIHFISDYVGMPLPKVQYLEQGISKYDFIPGVPLFRNEVLLLKDRDQDCVAEQIGTFLKQLHSIPLKTVQQNRIGEVTVDLTREGFLSEYENMQKKVYPYCDSYGKEYVKQIFTPMLENDDFLNFEPTLIHAGLTPRHFIYDRERRRLSGITGFGSAGIGDPAYDVSIILDNIGEAFVKRIGRYYSGIEDFIDRARFYSCVNGLKWEKEVADMIITRDFTNFKFPIKERDIMPIGSRW